MFMGEYHHNVDTKGRLIVPAKFREDLGEMFVLTRGLDQCLFGYPLNEWKIIEEKLKGLPMTKKDARAFTRFFFSGATVATGAGASIAAAIVAAGAGALVGWTAF